MMSMLAQHIEALFTLRVDGGWIGRLASKTRQWNGMTFSLCNFVFVQPFDLIA